MLVLPLGCSDFPFELGKECTAVGCFTFLRIELVFDSDVAPDAVDVIVHHDDPVSAV